MLYCQLFEVFVAKSLFPLLLNSFADEHSLHSIIVAIHHYNFIDNANANILNFINNKHFGTTKESIILLLSKFSQVFYIFANINNGMLNSTVNLEVY